MNIRELKRESKGITLISLIIVIIILLILTAIVVMASYNNGVINKADESSDQYDIGKEKEYLKLTFTHFQMNYMEKGLGFTNDEYETELKQYSENVKVDDASKEDIEKGIEIDFKESLGGYMKVTFKVTNNSYVVARIKARENTTPDIPDTPDIPETKKYIITYDANGGENAPRFQEKTENVSLKLLLQKPTRSGYTFIGWSTIKEPLAAAYQPGGDFDLDRDTTLYAVWQINTYTITYNLDGGTLQSQNPDSYTVETDTITLNNPSKDGYMFLGWTGSNGVIPQRTVKIEKGSTENKEYTAVYGEGNYRVNGTYYIDLKEAINACENNAETTIEVLKNCDDLFENNNIENKNIILNLGNNTLNLSKTINVKSGSSLKIIGEGKIQNQSDVAISVEGTLIIGEDDTTVGKTPIIEGTTFGISTSSGNLYFYDGQIIGDKAVNGEITKLPESYTALSKTENSKEVVYLDIVADAVARIGYKYFTTLQAAVDAAQSGHYDKRPMEEKLIDSVEKNGEYYFVKNADGQLVSNNSGVGNTTSHSYLKLDLSNFEGEHTLTINGLVSSEGNYDIAYAAITNSVDAPEYNNTTNRFIYTSGTNDINSEYKLQGGEIYYLHLGYRKDGSGNTGKDAFIINSIKLDGSETPELYKSYPVVGDTVEITMVDNATVSSAVTISEIQNIKLNLDGHTVQASGNTYVLDNSGKLEIVDTSSAQTGTIDNSAYRAIKNQKELILTSGTISIGAGTSSNYQRGIDNTETGTFTMNGGTIKSDKSYTRMIFNDNGKVYVNNGTITANSTSGQGIFNNKNGYVEINNGNITSGHYTICNTSTANSNGTIQINGGNITCTSNSADTGKNAIYNGSIGTVNIAGGTINENYYAIWQAGNGTMNITGGTLNGLGNIVNNRSSSGTINITGGVITGNSYLVRNESSKGEVVIENVELISKQSYNSVASGNSSSTTIINNSNVKGIENGNSSNLLIKGKSIITAKDANSNAISNGSGSIIIGEKIDEGVEEKPQTEPLIQGGKYGIYKNSVSGKIYFYDGTIKGTTNAIYGNVNEIEDKAEILINKSDGYEVATLTTDIQPVAQIGESTYKTLNEAINAVEGTEETTITILRDFEIIAPQTSSTIEEGKNIVIDLNGNSITSTLENTIINNGNLKIIDSNTEKQGTITLALTGSNMYVSGIVNETTGKIDIDNNITIVGKGIYSNSINNKGEITATNTKLISNGTYTDSQIGIRLISNTGILNLNNTTITHISGRFTYGIYNETGTININNLTIPGQTTPINTYEGEINITGTVTRTGTNQLIYLEQKSSTSEGTKLNITNATIIDTYNGRTNSLLGGKNGDIKINNSNITTKSTIIETESSYVIGIDVIIENSTLTSSDGNSGTTINHSKGDLEIKDSDIIYNGAYGGGCAIKLSNTANLTITGESNITTTTADQAIRGDSTGTIILGEKIAEGENEEPQTMPIIKGAKYGIYQNNTNGKLNFYDGTVIGSNSYQAIYGKITDMEAGYDVITKEDTEAKTLTATLERLPVAQIGENQYYSLYDAIQAVEGTEETTITLLRDFNITTTGQSAQIEEGKNVVIDLNGYNMTSTLENTIVNNGNLKITDSNTQKQGTIIINARGKSYNEYVAGIKNESTGKIEVNNNVTIKEEGGNYLSIINNIGELVLENANLGLTGISADGYKEIINNKGNMTIKGNSTINSAGYNQYYFGSIYGINNDSGTINVESMITKGTCPVIHTYRGTINITGTITRKGYGQVVYIEKRNGTNEETNIEIKNASIIEDESVSYTGYGVIYAKSGDGNIKISNSNLTSKSQILVADSSGINTVIENNSVLTTASGYGVVNYAKGDLEIKDSDIIYSGTSNCIAIQFASTGELKISGESNVTSTGEKSIFGTSTGTITLGEKIAEGEAEEPQTMPIIKGAKYGIYQNNTNGKLNFYDGTVIGSNSYQAIYGKITDMEAGYDVITKEDTEAKTLTATLERLPVAQIGENQYYSLYDAIQAVEGTEETTITLLRDFNITTTGQSAQIEEGKNVVIDLNGYNVISTLENTIINKGNLKITDNNTEKQGTMTINLQGKSSNEYSEGIVNESVGKIEVNNNVTIIGKGTLTKAIDNKGIMTTNNAVLNCVGTWRANLRLISNTGTLNLNDSKLIHQYDEYTYEIYNETGTVNVNNIITQGSAEAIINTYEGEVNVTGTVIRTGAEPLVSLKQKSSTSKGTTLNIINATITGGEVNYLINGEKGNVKISNSNITSKSGVINISNSGVIIEGSTFTCESPIISHNGKEGNLEIKDSNIIYNGTWTYGNSIRFQSTGSLTITGESNITSTGEKAIELTSTGNISIKGKVNVEGVKYGIYNSSTGTITLGENDSEVDRTYPCITGGEYGIYQSNSGGKLNFYDGQVKGKTGTIYGTITEIASGYEISKTNGDYYTDILVKSGVEVSVAKIGEVTYTSIQDAIAACPEGTQKTITIENNVIATSTITIPQGKDIILDLNGFTIIGENVDNVIENNGTLTILDGLNRGGKIENTSGTAIGGNGTLTVDSSATIVNGN